VITYFGQLTVLSCGPIMFPLSEPRNWRVTISEAPDLFRASVGGENLVAQGGARRSYGLRIGYLRFHEALRADVSGRHPWVFRIPLDRFGAAPRRDSAVSALTLSPGHPVTDVAATYFAGSPRVPTCSPCPADALSEPSIELMRASSPPTSTLRTRKDALKATLRCGSWSMPAHICTTRIWRGPSRRRASYFERHVYNVSRPQRNYPGRLIRNSASNVAANDIAASAFHAIPIASIARDGDSRSLKLYPHV